MFCTSLRKRMEWASVPSMLLSKQQPKWQELPLETHDIAIPLPQMRQRDPKEFFRLLLLSPVDIQPPEKSLARIERMYQTGGDHVGIVFFLNEKDSREGTGTGTRAFMTLQSILISSNIDIPILPLSAVSSLSQTISSFHQQLFQSHPPLPPVNPVIDLLPYCSNNPPIPEHARNVLSDICHSIPELAQAATTPDGQRGLKQWLTEPSTAVAEDVIGFWEQEYIAE